MSSLTEIVVWVTFGLTLFKTIIWIGVWSMLKLMMKEEQK
jgi:hypothetical protein